MAAEGFAAIVRETVSVGALLSVALHTGVIGSALFSLSSPPPLISIEEQGIEVDIASDIAAESGKGETEAQLDPKPVPAPTERPQTQPEAKNIGDASEDGASRRGDVTDKPLDTVQTTAAPKAEEVVAAPQAKPEPVETPEVEETPVPTPELARLNEPPAPVVEEVEPEQQAEAVSEAADPQVSPAIVIPRRAPTDRPKPQTAQTRDRTKPEEQKQERTASSREDRDTNTDRISELLNAQEDTESGVRRSTQVASLGAQQADVAAQLTSSEYDALKGRVGQCWVIPSYVDQENLNVSMLMRLSRDGAMAEIAAVEVSGVANPKHQRAIISSLQRNLSRRNCDFSDVLPPEKYETWKDVRINFVPRDF